MAAPQGPPTTARTNSRSVVMLASENDALKNGKVGGVGDVVRDLPNALADLGWDVTVITPSYGFLHKDNPSSPCADVRFPFSGRSMVGTIYEATPKKPRSGVTHLVFEHPLIGGAPIYFNDPPNQAFAQDATKYALFCSAVGQYLKNFADAVLHLHDWHTPALLLLRELHPDFYHLKGRKTVFTIHNLAIQGNRPMRGPHASVQAWFPELFSRPDWVPAWTDSRYREPNFTPMAAGISHADKVNTVSPSYAEEILLPSAPSNGLVRGEGLDPLLRRANAEGRLYGILNGCEYTEDPPPLSLPALRNLLLAEVRKWREKYSDPLFDRTLRQLEYLRDFSVILTSVTRIVDQKIRLLSLKDSRGKSALESILDELARVNGVYFVLGTGTPDYEEFLARTAFSHDRLVFLRGYSEKIANALYGIGSIFMMPSSFEPCGIGQMIAMRHGQPCVVHAVGGLKDTVLDGVDGFQFSGGTLQEQADALVETTRRAVSLKLHDPEKWAGVCAEAKRARFTWEKSARVYAELLYS